jgi:hypothetical protein
MPCVTRIWLVADVPLDSALLWVSACQCAQIFWNSDMASNMNRERLKIAIKWGVSTFFLVCAFGPIRGSFVLSQSFQSIFPKSYNFYLDRFAESWLTDNSCALKLSYRGYTLKPIETSTKLKRLSIVLLRNYELRVKLTTLPISILLNCWACYCQQVLLRLSMWVPIPLDINKFLPCIHLSNIYLCLRIDWRVP